MPTTSSSCCTPRERFSATAFTSAQQFFVDLEAKITEAWGYLNVVTYRFLCLIGEYDRGKGYERHGLVSTAQWLNWQCGIGMVAAREKVRVARALESLPEVSNAFRNGEISYSKVRAITRVATPANEAALVQIAKHGTASHVEKLVRKYRWTQRRDAGELANSQHLNRALHSFFEHDDTFVLNARLPPDVGALVRKALQVAGDILRGDSAESSASSSAGGAWGTESQPASAAAKHADALRLIMETFLACQSEEVEGTSSADRYQVVVHVDQAILAEPACATADASEPHRCELDDGPALALDTVRRLSCDCTLVGIVEGRDGEPLNIGRKTRAIPTAISRALKARDGGCRFPGCDRTRFTQGHHVKHWAEHGETKLDNLITLCGFHHTLVHEGGYGVTATDDGLFVFTRPDGTPIPAAGTAESFRGIVTQHRCTNASGGNDSDPDLDPFEQSLRSYLRRTYPDVHIDAHTSRCRWLGETMDYSLAIEGLQCLDRTAPPA